jgi:hypothetical protein
MRSLIFAVLMTLSLQNKLLAANLYYSYDDKPLTLSDDSFKRYAIPQLKGIVQEYYFLLKKIRPINNDLVAIKSQIQSMNSLWREWSAKCHDIEGECLSRLKEFYTTARGLDSKVLALQKQNPIQQAAQSTSIDSVLTLSRTLDEISNLAYKVLHLSERLMIIAETPFYSGPTGATANMLPLLHTLKLSSEQMITSQLGSILHEDFSQVYYQFIKSIEDNVIETGNKAYLLDRLEELNIVWNTFHMRMAKGGRDVGGNLGLVLIMHNRWNSILKIILI